MKRDLEQAGCAGRHQVYTWSGSSYEIGFQHGKTLRNEIIEEARGALDLFARSQSWTERKALDFALSQWEPLFQLHTPRAIEEIKGIAAGSGLDYAWTFFAAVHGGTKSRPHQGGGCTAFACGKQSTQDRKILMGQTKDTTAPLTRYRMMRLGFTDGPACLLLNYPGWLVHLGMNQEGLACTGNSLYAAPPSGETLPITFLRRLVMERASVAEVLYVIRGMAFDNGSTMIADPTGRIVCIECVAGKMELQDVSGQAFAHANSILCEGLQRYENAVLDSPSSPLRQTNLQRLLNSKRGSLTVNDLKRFLADRTNFPLSVCRHKSEKDPLWTTAALVANLTERELHVAIGNPCVAKFEKYDFSPMKASPKTTTLSHRAT